MTTEIDNRNAESIGRPIVEKAIQLFALKDHSQFLQCYPHMRVPYLTDASESLSLLGETPFVEYLDRLIKPDRHLLLWKVQSQNSSRALLLALALADNKSATSLVVMATQKLEESASKDAHRAATKSQISDENSELIGTPIIEKLVNSLLSDDFELYCQVLPQSPLELPEQTLEIFTEAVGVLKPMGNIISMKYLAHTKMTNLHTLVWKVRYQKEDEELMWQLMLTDTDAEIKLNGWSFDR